MARGDYISREAAEKVFSQPVTMSMCLTLEECKQKNAQRQIDLFVIRGIPAADVRPVVRGEWVAEKEDVEWGCSTVRYRCSHCGRLPHFDKESFKFLLSDFCPKCGADMREES